MVLLGWNVPSKQYDTFDMLDQVVAAEKVGFESISASDHFHPRDPSEQSYNICKWLGAAAARLNGMEITLVSHVLSCAIIQRSSLNRLQPLTG